MVYIAQREETQYIDFPRNATPDGSGVEPDRLILSRVGCKDVVLPVEGYGVDSFIYHRVSIRGTAGLETGEYNYSLQYMTGEVASCGIAVVGEYVRKTVEPDTERKVIEYGG